MSLKTISLIIALAGAFLISPQAMAAEPTPTGCQPIYNGGSSCSNTGSLSINKKVLKPSANVTPGKAIPDTEFIENIGPTDTGYPTHTLTAFRIYVTNTGFFSAKNITVKDILPPRYVTFVSGSNGTYDDKTRTFTATIKELKAKKTQTFTIQVITARREELPTDNTSLCTMNLAMATIKDKISQDIAQLCVNREAAPAGFSQLQTQRLDSTPTPAPRSTMTKGGLAVASPAVPQVGQNTPPTGPEALVLAGLLPTGLIGYLLRKKTS